MNRERRKDLGKIKKVIDDLLTEDSDDCGNINSIIRVMNMLKTLLDQETQAKDKSKNGAYHSTLDDNCKLFSDCIDLLDKLCGNAQDEENKTLYSNDYYTVLEDISDLLEEIN